MSLTSGYPDSTNVEKEMPPPLCRGSEFCESPQLKKGEPGRWDGGSTQPRRSYERIGRRWRAPLPLSKLAPSRPLIGSPKNLHQQHEHGRDISAPAQTASGSAGIVSTRPLQDNQLSWPGVRLPFPESPVPSPWCCVPQPARTCDSRYRRCCQQQPGSPAVGQGAANGL